MNNSFVALDFETTGLSPNSSRVIEIGAVKYKDGIEIDRLQTLVNPGVWSHSAERIHQIPYAEVKSAPKPSVAFTKLFSFVGNNLIVAHNCTFERGFYEYEANLLGMRVSNEFACTYQLSKKMISRALIADYKLKSVISYLKLTPSGPLHRALPDAILSGQIWLILSNIKHKMSGIQVNKISSVSTDTGIKHLRNGNIAQALLIFNSRINDGCSLAYAMLAMMYLEGHGVIADKPKALKYVLKSVENNNPIGCNILGEMYQYGKCVDINYTQSKIWINKSYLLGYEKERDRIAVCG